MLPHDKEGIYEATFWKHQKSNFSETVPKQVNILLRDDERINVMSQAMLTFTFWYSFWHIRLLTFPKTMLYKFLLCHVVT